MSVTFVTGLKIFQDGKYLSQVSKSKNEFIEFLNNPYS